MYFKKFPKIIHKLPDGSTLSLVDIITRVWTNKRFEHYIDYYTQEYLIEGYKTAENVAFELYNNVEYNWTIYIINKIINPYYDWIMSETLLMEYVLRTYENPNGIHHYENEYGDIIDPNFNTTFGIIPISNYQFEFNTNEKKRIIKVIYKSNIDDFVAMFNKEIMR